MKNKISLIFLFICILCMCVGCGKLWQGIETTTKSTEELITETLEKKYPEKTFEVLEQDGLYYNVVDEDGIEFQVEPVMEKASAFWCSDNYLDAYFQANGIVDQCNEVLERYNVENRVEIGEKLELNLGVLDDAENRAQMAECLDELCKLMQIPFEVTYYDKGTPQQGETYQGSSNTGTFSYISLNYTFDKPHISTFVGEGTILIKDIQEKIRGSELIEDIIVEVNEYDIIGEALEPEFCAQIKQVVAEGKRPVEVYKDDYRHFDISVEMIHAKISSNTDSPISTIKNEGKDENGYVLFRVTAENGEEMILHLGTNEKYAYSYNLEEIICTP